MKDYEGAKRKNWGSGKRVGKKKGKRYTHMGRKDIGAGNSKREMEMGKKEIKKKRKGILVDDKVK